MSKYIVTIRRKTFDSDDFIVEAENREEAKETAMQKAYDHEWGSGNAEYEVEGCGIMEPVVCSLCKKKVDLQTAHLHQGEFIGEDCGCWDDRLKASE